MTDGDGTTSRQETDLLAAQTAITELLARQVLGAGLQGDRQRAAALLEVLDRDGSDERAVFAAAIGAVCAAWDELGRWDSQTRRAALAAARQLPSRDAAPHLTTLGALAVCLMAFAGFSETPTADALRGAEILRTVQHHDLASWATHAVLSDLPVSDSQRARALILLAVVDHDAGAGEEAIRIACTLPAEDLGRRTAEALWPSLDFLGSRRPDLELRAALEAGDRPTAARRMAETIAALRTPSTDDAHLAGSQRAALALSSEQIDVEEFREGMRMMVGHWRELRRTGAVPPAARAGIENMINLLKRDLTGPAPQLLFEVVEALADHGLTTLNDQSFRADPGDLAAAALVHAQMSASAAVDVRWPDIPWIVSRLCGTHVMLTHTERRFSDDRLEVIALYLRPPTYPALNQVSLDPALQSTLDQLATQRLQDIVDIGEPELLALIRMILPPPLLELLQDGTARPPVVIVPDGPLWAIPWHAVRSATPVVIAPSMTMYATIEPPKTPIRRILALVDQRIPGSEPVVVALNELRDAGFEVTERSSRTGLDSMQSYDLLVIFAHGSGHGLDYRLMLPEGSITALELASVRPPARTLIASCWSARLPPVSFPLSLPTALLLAGSRTVVGGLWPLPAVTTGDLVARTLRALPSDNSLAIALHTARQSDSGQVADRLGLTTFGTVDFAPEHGADLSGP